ncbi:MAG: amino acid adenylation domain-containing protein, partial [bacterium]|nr:amino acid adenylation domain-containing protein [bacterium]
AVKEKTSAIPQPASGIQIAYRELNKKVNRLARYLRKKGVSSGPVGILMKPTPQMIISILAVSKAGGAYMPVDPANPGQRIKIILKDSGATHLLIHAGTTGQKPQETHGERIKIIDLDIEAAEIAKEKPGNPIIETTAGKGKTKRTENLDKPIYIIYTSGTTGKPKGAAVNHRNFFNLITWFVFDFQLKEDDRNIVITSVSFDLTQKNLFAPLVTGGTLILPELEYFEPAAILKTINEKKITWINCTPSMIYKIVRFSDSKGLKALTNLRYLFLGGEPIAMKMLRKWLDTPGFKTEIVNTYGPTECTDICSYYRTATPREYIETPMPAGNPVYNAHLYVLDPSHRPLPVGIPGELFIGGEGVGPGYINDPRLTSEKFIDVSVCIHSPHSQDSPEEHRTAKLYRTGDLVKRHPDGAIEFIGRVDLQVKIRGYRIELGEIENRLLKHEKIKAAVALALHRETGTSQTGEQTAPEKYLCAYYVSGEELDINTLRKHQEKELPGYMTPTYFIKLDKIPLTVNGKIDKKALSQLQLPEHREQTEYTAPRNEIEKKLTAIWSQVLDIETGKISINDDFFNLGGHSLKVITVTTMIYEQFTVEITVGKLFQYPTIKELATCIEKKEKITGLEIEAVEEREYYDISYAQRRLWIACQYEKKTTAYNMVDGIYVSGEFNKEAFDSALQTLVTRHQSLRTQFIEIEGTPKQRIIRHLKYKPQYIDLRKHTEEDKKKKLSKISHAGANHYFNLEKAPLFLFKIIRLEEKKYYMLINIHHIINDGWSALVMRNEISQLYNAYNHGNHDNHGTPALPPLEYRYLDYTAWHNATVAGGYMERSENYWLEKFKDHPNGIELPIDKPRPPIRTFNGGSVFFQVEKKQLAPLKGRAKENDITLFMKMLTILSIILAKYGGGEEIIIASPTVGRKRRELQSMVGFLV